MIELHYFATGNNLKVGILLEEIEIPYSLVKYDMLAGTHLTPSFRKINPNNKLPAIVDHAPADGGPPFPVFESGAILLYLSEKVGRFLPSIDRRRIEALQWLVWQVAGLGPMHGQAHHFVLYAPEDQTYGIDRYTREARRLLDVLEYRLEQEEYLAGEYSIADIASFPWVRRSHAIGIDVAEYPFISTWLAKIEDRPAVRRAIDAILDGNSNPPASRETLTAEQWSNLFGERMHDAARQRE